MRDERAGMAAFISFRIVDAAQNLTSNFMKACLRETGKAAMEIESCDLATGIRDGDISCREAVSSVLERMREKTPELNGVVIDLSEQALTQAQSADDMVRFGVRLGPLNGVPVTIKANVDVKGLLNSNGIVDTAALYLADAGYAMEAFEAPFSEELSELWKSPVFSEMRQLMEQSIRD